MTSSAAYAVLMIVFGTMAVASFLMQGRQWPTAITAGLFGLILGGTEAGTAIGDWLAGLLRDVAGSA